MVQAAISAEQLSELITDRNLNAQCCVTEVLTPDLLPFMEAHPVLCFFQQDRACNHAALLICNFLEANDVLVMELDSMFSRHEPHSTF